MLGIKGGLVRERCYLSRWKGNKTSAYNEGLYKALTELLKFRRYIFRKYVA